MSIAPLRNHALALFRTGLAAADPAKALSLALDRDAELLAQTKGKTHLIAVGKAAIPMMGEALSIAADWNLGEVLAVTNYENVPDAPAFPVIGAAHPVPDQNGLLGGQEVIRILDKVTADDMVLLLLSGGGSALLPCPEDGMSLTDKMAVTDLLLKSGADITEMNQVRRALSKLKGGGLAELSAPARLRGYILSDVPGDDLKDIASGPSVLGSTDRAAAKDVVTRFGLWDRLPESARTVLDMPGTTVSSDDRVVNQLIGSNRMSVTAMADALNDQTFKIVSDWLEGPVADAATAFVDLIEQSEGRCVFICGGETAVEVTGTGLGGRNQEMALRVALLAEQRKIRKPFVFLSGGTDGRDGPTDAAGGLVDPYSISRMRAVGIDVEARLADNDSYHALQGSDDLVMTGGTGTNVADLQICVVSG